MKPLIRKWVNNKYLQATLFSIQTGTAIRYAPSVDLLRLIIFLKAFVTDCVFHAFFQPITAAVCCIKLLFKLYISN